MAVVSFLDKSKAGYQTPYGLLPIWAAPNVKNDLNLTLLQT